MDELMKDESKRNYKPVFTIIERGDEKKPYYMRIGTAFVNRDQSLNVKLDGYPTNGSLHIRDFKPWELERMAQNNDRFSGGAS